MDNETFNEWLDQPAAEYFQKYLKDSIKEESELIAERIKSGGIVEEPEQIRVATTCLTLERISEITFQEIEDFYQQEE